MKVILNVSHKDAAQALKLARWITELGGANRHTCLLAINKTAVEMKMHTEIESELKKSFCAVDHYIVHDHGETKWPYPQNNAFIRVNKDVIQNSEKPFFWLEPDAIPLKASWMDDIEHEYNAVGKLFMGDYVQVGEVPPHMSGIGVYRQMDFNAPSYVTSSQFAWDVVTAAEVLPKAHITKLIEHQWKPEPFKTSDDLNRIRPHAVIYHQDKLGSIIDVMQRSNAAYRDAAYHLPPNTVDSSSVEAALLRENDLLRERLALLEKALVVPKFKPVKPTKRGNPRKPKRTPEQQAAIDARMKKARDARKK